MSNNLYLLRTESERLNRASTSSYVGLVRVNFFKKHNSPLFLVNGMIQIVEMKCIFDRTEIDIDTTLSQIDPELARLAMLYSAEQELQNQYPDFTPVYSEKSGQTPTEYHVKVIGFLTACLMTPEDN